MATQRKGFVQDLFNRSSSAVGSLVDKFKNQASGFAQSSRNSQFAQNLRNEVATVANRPVQPNKVVQFLSGAEKGAAEVARAIPGGGRVLQAAGLAKPLLPQYNTGAYQAGKIGSQIVATIPLASAGAAAGAGAVARTTLSQLPRVGQYIMPAAQIIGAGTLTQAVATPGGLKERAQAVGQTFSPTNLALNAPFVALGAGVKAVPGAGKLTKTPQVAGLKQPQLSVKSSEAVNKAFQTFAKANPSEPLVIGKDQRLFNNIADAIVQKRVNVEDIPYFKQLGYTNNQAEEVADAFRTVATFSGRTLNQLSQTAKFISSKLPDVKPQPETYLDRTRAFMGRFINNAVSTQGAALVSNFYTAARNALVGTAKLPIQAIDDAIAGGIEAATGKATPRQAFAPLAEDFISIFRAFTPKEGQAMQQLFDKYPMFKDKLYSTPIAELTLGNKVTNALTIVNRFQDSVFTKIRFDAIVRSEMTRRGVKNMSNLPANVINHAVNESLKFTFRGQPDSKLLRNFVRFSDNPIMKLAFFRFPRFMALAMEHTLNYSPLGYTKLLDPKFQKLLTSPDRRVAIDAFAKATTGTMLLAAGQAIRTSDFAGNKWYEVKLPDGKVLDARGFQPLSSYLFIGELMTHGFEKLNGKDLLEGATGINRVSGTGLVVLDAVRSSDPGATIQKLATNFAGQFLGGFTVPFRQFNLAAAALGNKQEEAYRTTKENPLLGPAIANVPVLRNILPVLPEVTKGSPVKTEYPGLRSIGISVSKPSFVKSELSNAGIETKDILPYTGNAKVDRFITREMGTVVEQIGKRLEQSPNYQRLDPEQRGALLKEIVGEVRSEMKQVALVKNRVEIAKDFDKMLRGKDQEQQIKVIKKLKDHGLLTPEIRSEMLKLKQEDPIKQGFKLPSIVGEVKAAEAPQSNFPYRLEQRTKDTTRIYYPSGDYSDVPNEQVEPRLAKLQQNFEKFGKGKYPDYAPNWQAKEEPPKTVNVDFSKEKFATPIKRYFGKQAANAVRVLGGENARRDPNAENHNSDGSIDRGLFQINSNTFADFMKRKGALLRENGIRSYDDMFDPTKNTIMASIIYKEQGWNAWYGSPPDLRKR